MYRQIGFNLKFGLTTLKTQQFLFFCRQSKVSISDVTQAHLVAYDHERDFLPMVYAHCDYSLEIGRGTEVTYNLPGLERQLIETFVRGKPYIDIKVVDASLLRLIVW